MPDALRIELVEAIGGLDQRVHAWSELLDDAQGGLDVFRSPGWVLPWWRHLGRAQQIHCLFVWEGERLVGLAPLVRATEEGARVLRFMGDPLNDYNSFILRRGFEAPAGEAIRAFLTGTDTWDRLEFDCLLDGERALGTTSAGGLPGLSGVPLAPPPTVLLELPSDWESYRSGPITGRRTLERKERKLWREAGARFQVCRDAASVASLVPELDRLRLANWQAFGFAQSRDALLFGPAFSAFLHEASPVLAEAGRLRIGAIEGSRGLLAGGIYLAGRGVMMKYMQGWDHSDPSSSVGLILDWLMIRDAIESGFECFDFGRGDEAYKYRLGGRSHRLTGWQYFPAGFRGRLAWTRAAALHSARVVKRRLVPPKIAHPAPQPADDAA